jgi:hypothetical protein
MRNIKTYEKWVKNLFESKVSLENPRIYEPDDTEKYEAKEYWMIANDDRFESALREVCDYEGWIQVMVYNSHRKYFKYIFIGKSYDLHISNVNNKKSWYYELDWGWNEFNGKPRNDYFEEEGYKFMGYLGMTKEEIEDFEFQINVQKYNL